MNSNCRCVWLQDVLNSIYVYLSGLMQGKKLSVKSGKTTIVKNLLSVAIDCPI